MTFLFDCRINYIVRWGQKKKVMTDKSKLAQQQKWPERQGLQRFKPLYSTLLLLRVYTLLNNCHTKINNSVISLRYYEMCYSNV